MSSDEPMRRTPGVSYEPDGRADVLDFVADYGLDAVDAGVDAEKVASALREAADEIDYQAREGNIGIQDEAEADTDDEDNARPEPTRSEPADFGGGETTGVQDL